jgi:hypothetical protein
MSPESQSFYSTVSAVSFVLLGLWWVVVQSHPEWHNNPARRRMAYVVSLHFVLPGAMSIFAIASPDVPLVWRVSFTLAGLLGIAGVLYVIATLRTEHDCPRLVRTYQWVVLPAYILITVLAAAPELVKSVGLSLTTIQVESLILSLILFFGVQSAWVLAIEPTRANPDDPGSGAP